MLTPKDKAEELIQSFRPEHALIVVDEILAASPVLNASSSFDSFYDRMAAANKYWEEVKDEINKL